jgi:hypothetical protein
LADPFGCLPRGRGWCLVGFDQGAGHGAGEQRALNLLAARVLSGELNPLRL